MTMKRTEVLRELERLGTAENRKVYGRHGVSGPMFGVSYANLAKLEKKLGADQELAERLWESGNHDARVLAAKIADPERIESSTLDAWARDLDSYPVADAFAALVGRTSFVETKLRKWTRTKREFVGQVGWILVALLALRDDDRSDAFFEPLLETIEARIHTDANRIRHSMNNALIAIGMRNSRLEKQAVAAARRIGEVEVDHGETGCKTPDAVAYIARAKGRGRRRRR